MSSLRHIIYIVRIWTLKCKARRLAAAENDRQFVVKLNGKVVILSKRTFKMLKHHGVFPRTLTQEGLKHISLYYTP